jgi:demethylmenaquinone methyltransferase/2-methoxy-6-polyprenyl-1,4-benzoquinol methylase
MFSVMNRYHQSIDRYIGLDLSKNMMSIGNKRRTEYDYSQKIEFVHGSGTQIPYEDQTFDCVTMAFGIRNIVNFQECLSELYRVLKANGSVMIMEFSLPKNRIIKGVYLLYFRWILPFIGGLLSGDRDAYAYLNKTVESFPYADAFKKELEHVGFSVSMTTLSFGIATLYIGKK